MNKGLGYATRHSFTGLKPLGFEHEEAGPSEVLHCGVCNSDIHQAENDWGDAVYTCMPGHEIVGRVTKAASRKPYSAERPSRILRRVTTGQRQTTEGDLPSERPGFPGAIRLGRDFGRRRDTDVYCVSQGATLGVIGVAAGETRVKKPLAIRIDADLLANVRDCARHDNRTLTNFIETVLRRRVEEMAGQSPGLRAVLGKEHEV
ncbi:alcohol dehydrogenase catalytic domain-containing protein [Methylobacterium sp. E-016]|uniref:alcohol dehydrogenase catalytic domain-containing protein n=1 Tax=Methylobacterium sp. E-016 TaxID=2836556 RepID=UPI0028BEE671|nr:alcohol dehydrogenase catalytic domain-containing protein [Methylobacterium sp. E-016]